MPIIALVITLKFLLPVLYLRWPFAAGWANLVWDSVDGDLLMPAGLPEPTYQVIDKIADYWAYGFMVAWAWRHEIRREAVAAFLLRTVGQVPYFVTRNELALFFFPNLIEPLFLVYATIGRLKGWDRAAAIYRAHRRAIWIGILAYKLQDEWITHVANIDRSDAIEWLMRRAGR